MRYYQKSSISSNKLILNKVLPKNIIEKLDKKYMQREFPINTYYLTRAQGSLIYISWAISGGIKNIYKPTAFITIYYAQNT